MDATRHGRGSVKTSSGSNPASRPSLAIIGMGRMGRAVDELASAGGWSVSARLDLADAPLTRQKLGGASVAIDFTTAKSVPATVRACVAAEMCDRGGHDGVV